MSYDDYVIREAKPSDTPAIMNLLEEYYIPEEAITSGFIEKNKDRLTIEEETNMKNQMQKLLLESGCVVAVNKKTNDIVACVIIAKMSKSMLTCNSNEQSPLMNELKAGVYRIYKDTKFFERFPSAKKIFKLRYLTVHKDHRGKGLAKGLLKDALEWCKRMGSDLVYSFFLVPISKKAAESVGFKEIEEYDLNRVKDAKGEMAFTDLRPRNLIAVMIVNM